MTEQLRKEVQVFREGKKAAEGKAQSLTAAIGNRKPPVMADIQKETEDAEHRLKSAESLRDQIRSVYKDNKEADHILSPMLQERQKLVEEHGRIDHLYRLVSGNVSGSRMDLETYVQRYYLERSFMQLTGAFGICLRVSLSFGCIIWKRPEKEKPGT